MPKIIWYNQTKLKDTENEIIISTDRLNLEIKDAIIKDSILPQDREKSNNFKVGYWGVIIEYQCSYLAYTIYLQYNFLFYSINEFKVVIQINIKIIPKHILIYNSFIFFILIITF